MISLPFMLYLVFQGELVNYAGTLYVVMARMSGVFSGPQSLRELWAAFLPWSHNFKYALPLFFYLFSGLYLLKRVIRKKMTIAEFSIIPVFIYGVFLYKCSFMSIEGPRRMMALQPLLWPMRI